MHFHVYLSRIGKFGRIKPKIIHKLILVGFFSLEHGICKIQDCLAGGGIMCQLMWQVYSRTFAFFFASTFYYNFESLCQSLTKRDLYYYIFLHFLNFNYPLANEVSERLYTCNNANVRPSAIFRACENTK